MMTRLRDALQRLNAHPRSRDAAAAVLWLLLGIALLQLGAFRLTGVAIIDPGPGWWSSETLFLLVLVAMAGLATMRSRRPFLALAAALPLVVVDLLLGTSLGVAILFSDLVYCAFRYGGDRGVRILLAAIIATSLGAGGLLFAGGPDALRYAPLALQWALFVLLAALWGWSVRSERQRTRSAMSRAHARATQDLRSRIAHDLHDLVANQIAVAGLNIEAARVNLPEPAAADDRVRRSLEHAKQGTDDAHRELRRLITLLTTIDRVDDAADRPRVDLQALVPGGRVIVRDGGVDDSLGRLEPRAAGIVSRVLHELVTNAVKHGEGDIHVVASTGDAHDAARAGALVIRVSNAIADGPAAAPGTGIGISGASMLLSDIGGELASAADGHGRWTATIVIEEESDV